MLKHIFNSCANSLVPNEADPQPSATRNCLRSFALGTCLRALCSASASSSRTWLGLLGEVGNQLGPRAGRSDMKLSLTCVASLRGHVFQVEPSARLAVLAWLQMLAGLGEAACHQAKPNAAEGALPVSRSGIMSNAPCWGELEIAAFGEIPEFLPN